MSVTFFQGNPSGYQRRQEERWAKTTADNPNRRWGLRNVRRVPSRETRTNGEQDWGKVVERQIWEKPEKPRNPRGLTQNKEEEIRWDVEVVENYNLQGDLGIILQFMGINLTQASFLRGRRDYGPETTLFYQLINYNKKRVLLLLSTCGDIFEAQVVPKQKDVDLLFREEIYLPQLTKTHNPRSMAVSQNNNLAVVSYKPL